MTWKTYVDKKFGYSIEHPDIFNAGDDAYIDGDGRSIFSRYTSGRDGAGKYAFEIFGGQNTEKATAGSRLRDWLDLREDEYGHVNGVKPIGGTAQGGSDFYTLAYIDDSAGIEAIRHIYGVVRGGRIVEYYLRYPKEDAEKFAAVTRRMDASLCLK